MSKLDDFIANCYHKGNSVYHPEELLVALLQWYMAYQKNYVLEETMASDGNAHLRRMLWGATRIGAEDHMLVDRRASLRTKTVDYKLNANGIAVLREEGLLK